MAKGSRRLQEVVWTGRSDRRLRSEVEPVEPSLNVPPLTLDLPSASTPEPLAPLVDELAAANMPPPTKKRPAPESAPGEPQQTGRIIAKAVVGSFIERIKTEAQRKGGRLTLKDIEGLDREFEQKTAALETLFERTFEEYARRLAAGETAEPEQRMHPFDRLIVAAFEKLLSGGTRKGSISRRIMPGFFLALSMMMGPDVMADFRMRAERIFARVNPEGRSDWPRFLDDPAARDLRMDALISMCVHFANPDKRAQWFMDLINDHLAPPETDPDSDPNWTLSRPGYERLIDALFADLLNAVASPRAREGITRRFGPETCASINEIMKGLGA